MLLGLVASFVLASGSLLHAVGMATIGLLLGMVGTDASSGVARYSFGFFELVDGINFVVIAMGLYGVSEIVSNLENESTRSVVIKKVKGLMPSREDFSRIVKPILRGTGLGSILGILPGGGAMLAAFAAYALEKKLSAHPETFGKGAIEGVAAPEAANNAGAQTSFIPMLTLGIPSNPVMALMIGALVIQGIQPGPSVMTQQPDLFWGLIVSMWIGNLFLVVLNLPLIGVWVKMISIPYHYLYRAILAFSAIGVFSLSNATFDIYLMAGFGVFGYFLRKINAEFAPLLLAFILGPMMEDYLRRALLLSNGDPLVLLERPGSAIMLFLAAALVALVFAPRLRRTRDAAFEEEAA